MMNTRIELYEQCDKIIDIKYADLIKIDGYSFYLSHYPTYTANYDDDKPWAKHLFNLHGHTHSKDKFFNNNPYMYNIALDAHNNFPVYYKEIIDDIKNKKMELDKENNNENTNENN